MVCANCGFARAFHDDDYFTCPHGNTIFVSRQAVEDVEWVRAQNPSKYKRPLTSTPEQNEAALKELEQTIDEINCSKCSRCGKLYSQHFKGERCYLSQEAKFVSAYDEHLKEARKELGLAPQETHCHADQKPLGQLAADRLRLMKEINDRRQSSPTIPEGVS